MPYITLAPPSRRRAHAEPPAEPTSRSATDALLLHKDDARSEDGGAPPQGSRSPGVESRPRNGAHGAAPRQSGHLPYWATFAVRSSLVLLTALLAAAVPKFELVASFVGSFANGLVAYMLPPLLYMRLCRPQGARAGAWTPADVFHSVLFAILTLGSFYSAGVVFWALVDPS